MVAHRTTVLVFLVVLVLLSTMTPAGSRSVQGGESVEKSVGNLRRTVVIDLWGSRRFTAEFLRDETRLMVFLFLSPECPLVNLYLPRLVELEQEYRGQGVQFLGIYPNASETLNSMALHAQDRDIPFPVLKDVRNQLTEALGAERTPEVVVVDDQLVTRYQGLIDDQYRVGARRTEATGHYLRDALEQLLAGKQVEVPVTLASGCLIERYDPDRHYEPVTYNKDVAPIFQKKCQTCHRPDQAAPFSLLTYRQVKRHARMIEEVVLDRRMPPWHAVTDHQRFGSFANDRRLSEQEIQTIEAWVRTGMAEGDPDDLPAPVQWPSDWQIGEPDVVFHMEEAYDVPAEGELPYIYQSVNTRFREGRWVQAAEVRPGDPSVVHHINVHVTRPGTRRPFGLLGLLRLYGMQGERARVLANYVPGDTVRIYPEGMAVYIPAGYDLTFELHYVPTGKPAKDRSYVGMVFAEEPPHRQVQAHGFITRGFKIPPGDPHFRVENTLSFDDDIWILNLKPHMHKRGKHWRYELVYPNGETETLLSVPRWDYDWQSIYEFESPVHVPAGTQIRAIAHWDNSPNNPNNPDPTAEVRWGLQLWDEMMLGWVTYVKQPLAPEDLDQDGKGQAE